MSADKTKTVAVSIGVGAALIGLAYAMYRSKSSSVTHKVSTAVAGNKISARPPIAKKKPYEFYVGTHKHNDPYFWMRDDTRSDAEIISHLEAENRYCDAITKDSKPLQEKIYKEFISHLKEDDEEPPYVWDEFVYYSRTKKGASYPIYCRKQRTTSRKDEHKTPEETLASVQNIEVEQVLLDVNEMAKGHEFYDLNGWEPSPDHSMIAFAVDTSGYETYDIFVKDLKTGKLLPDKISGATSEVEWGDNRTLFYSTQDSAHRPDKLYRHQLGQTQDKDELVYHEPDPLFNVEFYRSTSGKYLFVRSGGAVTSETHFIDLTEKKAVVEMIEKRQHNVLYTVKHSGDHLYILTNSDGAYNFKLMRTHVTSPSRLSWQTVLPHKPEFYMESIQAFQDHLVVSGRLRGLSSIQILSLTQLNADFTSATSSMTTIAWPESVYSAELGVNKQFDLLDQPGLRVHYGSMVTPPSTFDFSTTRRTLTLVKEKEVPFYNRTLYTTQRIEATARDGTKVPMSMVYRKSVNPYQQTNKVFMVGYGSYSVSYDPDFESRHLSFLDRGIVVVIAHLRGGGEMGRQWYENGKFLHKKNTFTDFIDCAKHLIDTKFTTPDQLAISGGSAGGLLMGAVLNMAPELFRVCYTRVPFVDVMATMCDASIPLTANEWEEWGNPTDEKFYDYMLSYSPYDNVRAQKYPNLLVTTGLNDSRVAYWEPMKWVAKLRELKTDDNVLLLKSKTSGHGGSSGRYEYLEEQAFNFSFVLTHLGIHE